MLNENCLVLPDDMKGKQKSGLILLKNPQEIESGTVILAGPGEQMSNGNIRPNACKVGEKVYFGKFAGTSITHKGKEYLIIDDESILARIV